MSEPRERGLSGEQLMVSEDDHQPTPMILFCPSCFHRHIDAGEFRTKPHHTHACQNCKLPSGMILRLFRPEMRLEPGVPPSYRLLVFSFFPASKIVPPGITPVHSDSAKYEIGSFVSAVKPISKPKV